MSRSGNVLLLLIVLFLSFSARPAHAFYKWVDDKGMLHVTDYPPPSKTPQPAPEPEAPKAATTPTPISASPVPIPTPSVPVIRPVSLPQTTQTKSVPATATKPSSTVVSLPAPTIASVPTASPPAFPVPRPQRMPFSPAGAKALAGGLLMVIIAISLAFYVYYALSMYLIAKKLNVAEAWMSWVPLLNLWPFLTSAGKPCWWVILLLIPLVNIIVIVYLWMCICENLGRNKWLGLLIMVPVVSLILPGVLAFSRKD